VSSTSNTRRSLLIAAFVLIAAPVFAMTGPRSRPGDYGRGRQDGRQVARAILPMFVAASASGCCGFGLPSVAWTGWNSGRREFRRNTDGAAAPTGCGTCCGFGPGLSLFGALIGIDRDPAAVAPAALLPATALVGKPVEYVQGYVESCKR